MLEFSLNNRDLQKALSKTAGILSKNTKNEIYSLVKITIGSVQETLSMTLEVLGSSIYLKTTIPCNTSSSQNQNETTVFLLKPELLQEILPLVKDEVINFSLDLEIGTLTFKSSKTKQVLKTHNHLLSEFTAPVFSKGNDDQNNLEVDFNILAKDFQKALKISQVSVGLPKYITDPKFLNICFNLSTENILTVVSTDKYRLSVLNIPVSMTKDNPLTRVYLFQPKSLQTIASYIGDDQNSTLRFRLCNDYAWIDVANNLVAVQYSGHEYPDAKKIIPQSFSYMYNISTQELKDALKQALVIAKKIEKNKAINLTIDGLANRLQISSKSPDGSTVETELAISDYSSGEDVKESDKDDIWQQGFNIDYLLDFIAQIDEPTLTMEHQGKKLVISPEGKKETIIYLASGLA
jgi:DNA polymerase III sliding clamp (beta) subunit (PCNA family)